MALDRKEGTLIVLLEACVCSDVRMALDIFFISEIREWLIANNLKLNDQKSEFFPIVPASAKTLVDWLASTVVGLSSHGGSSERSWCLPGQSLGHVCQHVYDHQVLLLPASSYQPDK